MLNRLVIKKKTASFPLSRGLAKADQRGFIQINSGKTYTPDIPKQVKRGTQQGSFTIEHILDKTKANYS